MLTLTSPSPAPLGSILKLERVLAEANWRACPETWIRSLFRILTGKGLPVKMICQKYIFEKDMKKGSYHISIIMCAMCGFSFTQR